MESFPTYDRSEAVDFENIQTKTRKSSINVGKLLKIVENIAAKGEIASFEQFLLLPQCSQKSSAAEASESIYIWERVKIIIEIFNKIFTKSASGTFLGKVPCL